MTYGQQPLGEVDASARWEPTAGVAEAGADDAHVRQEPEKETLVTTHVRRRHLFQWRDWDRSYLNSTPPLPPEKSWS